MTLGEHLEELRSRLIKSTVVILVVFCVGWAFRNDLTRWTMGPYRYASVRLNADLKQIAGEEIAKDPDAWEDWYTPPPELEVLRPDRIVPDRPKGDAAAHGLFFQMKMCFYYALFIGGPFLLWQMWQFIAAGLYKNEKRVVHSYFPLSALLFLGGVLFGYFVMVPNALYFLASMTIREIQYWETIGNYWTFLVALTLALGTVFQLPVVMVALTKVGLVEPRFFSKYRPHMLVGSLVVGALLTPPDPFTQLMMAVPIVILYEAGHLAARAVHRKQPATPGVPAESPEDSQ